MSYDSNQLVLDLCDFSPRVQLNLQTMLCLLSDSPKVYILITPLTFRPPKGRGRPFSWVTKSFQASKISLCTLFQSRPSSYQGNVIRLLGVELGQKATSGELKKIPRHFILFRKLNSHAAVLLLSDCSGTTFLLPGLILC